MCVRSMTYLSYCNTCNAAGWVKLVSSAGSFGWNEPWLTVESARGLGTRMG